MTDREAPEGLERTRRAGRTVYDTTREAMIAGLAVVFPLLVTIVVLSVLAGYVVGFLDVVVTALISTGISPFGATGVVYGLVVAFIVGSVFVVGFVTRFRYGEQFVEFLDSGFTRIPGIGSIYESFREMSDVIIDEQESFNEVKLVEFPAQGTYTLGFVTSRSPPAVTRAVEEETMYTMFLPLAPNPVMGGHLSHVPEHRVVDVDMTVEEGIQSVVTTGVATGEDTHEESDESLSEADLKEMARFEGATTRGEETDRRTVETETHERTDEYADYAAPNGPSEAATPQEIRDYRSSGHLGRDEQTPDAVRSSEADRSQLLRHDAGGDASAAPDLDHGDETASSSQDLRDGGVDIDRATPEDVEAVAGSTEPTADADGETPTEIASDDRSERRGDTAETPTDVAHGDASNRHGDGSRTPSELESDDPVDDDT